MQKGNPLVRIGVTAFALGLASVAIAGGEAGKLELRDLGGKFVAYSTKSADNGSLDVMNPLFVQYILPARRRHDHPIVFIHGGGGQGTERSSAVDGEAGMGTASRATRARIPRLAHTTSPTRAHLANSRAR